ncbi:MAG TPA: (2Fe-2S)-binding protein [Pseudorhodoplanes sp.]|jgi:nicotinate dehydrogenase subunit A|nr:(2Fe-2S)-binding protein [Pseudorhodoplanes sp.]
MASYAFQLNKSPRSVECDDPDKPLLYVLRDLGLTAAKFGCGLGQCGACTVLIDGEAARSCQTSIADVKDRSVTTLEGLGNAAAPHPLQAAFIREQVPQCGYCTNGMIMTAAGLLARNPRPSEEDIRNELEGNLCRCGSHVRVVRAVLAAAGQGG